MRPLFQMALDDPRRKGSLLWRIWWHHGDKVWWIPMWVWRPVCWFSRRQHTSDSYGACVICRKPEKRAANGRSTDA